MKKTMTMLSSAMVLLLLLSSLTLAGEKEEAKKELEKMNKVMKFSKSVVIPLMNCFAQHQPHLQFLNGEYPDRGTTHVNAMDSCLTKFDKECSTSPELEQIRAKVYQLTEQDVKLGRRYIDSWKEYNALREKFNQKKKDKAAKEAAAKKKEEIEATKQMLYKHATEFKKAREAFSTYNKAFNKKYVEVRKAAK